MTRDTRPTVQEGRFILQAVRCACAARAYERAQPRGRAALLYYRNGPACPYPCPRGLLQPRVTVSITSSGTQLDNDLLTLDVPPGLSIKDLKGFIEAETGQPAASQGIFLNGQTLANETQTLEEAGIRDGEMLAVVIRQARRPANPHQPSTSRGAARPAGSPDPEALRQQLLSDPRQLAGLRSQDPALAAAVNDPTTWREEFTMRQRAQQDAERERREQIQKLNEDPFNIDAQRKIEELIRQDRVVENLEKAYNENPEVFVRVHMLYVNTEVNGIPVKAFVDSGAQATIMSPSAPRGAV
ncbi:hypothetical protein EJ07DRAFT_154618 [Lizonia empirigonia]|nr:hypothetical protein EJ07DRAFT_154618 [Lizonia empirigonia]